jgi:hypothetical protein
MANFKLKESADSSASTGLATNPINILPIVGFIMPFLGPSTSVPSGWVFCDGSNGTPDLRGDMIYGSTTLGALSETHVHTVTHTVNTVTSSEGGAHTSVFNTAVSIPANTTVHSSTLSGARIPGAQINDGENANRISGNQANVIQNDHNHNVYPTASAAAAASPNPPTHTHNVTASAISSTVWSAAHTHSKTGSSSNITGTTLSGAPAQLIVNFIMYVGV